MARYREIADDIRAKIKSGVYPEGGKLPSISELMDAYKVDGLQTIRNAQQLLVEEGYLASHQGVGVFVISKDPGRGLDIPAALTSARDTLERVLAALAMGAKHTVTFDLDSDDTRFVLMEALREFAARERWRAEHDDASGESQIQLAEQAEALIETIKNT
jgi:DNA-binding GntR family transcriptional regulator